MDINPDILLKYIHQELSSEEVKDVEAWIDANTENRVLLTNLFLAYQTYADKQLFDKIDTHEALIRLKTTIYRKKKKKENKKTIRIARQIAAIALIPLLILAGYLLPHADTETTPYLVDIATNPGVISRFELPDSTEIWLNAGSKLTYPSDFNLKNRWVTLNGEGYFNVKKKGIPFEVKVDSAYSIKVLGTTFNVQAYSDEKHIRTTLLNGCVQLNYLSENTTMETCYLRKNESSYYQKDNRNMMVKPANIEHEIAWKNGRIIFENRPLREVLHVLSRHYNVEFTVLNDQIYKSSITGKFDNEQLPQILNYINEATGIKSKYNKGVPTSKGLIKNRIILYK